MEVHGATGLDAEGWLTEHDPYVWVQLLPECGHDARTMHKHGGDHGNPTWDASLCNQLSLELCEGANAVALEIWSKGIISDSFLGERWCFHPLERPHCSFIIYTGF